jgi:hypothetical protein
MTHITSKTFRLVALGIGLVLSLTASGATAEGETSSVKSQSATLTASAINVSGLAAFTRDEVTIGTSASGSTDVPPAPPGIGMDLAAARVRQVDQNALEFNLDVRDMPTANGRYGLNEVVHYDWDFNVVRNGTVTAGFTLSAIPSAQGVNPGSLDPILRLMTCAADPQTGQDTCGEVGPLQGSIHANGITFRVPLSMLNAPGGAVLTQNYDGVVASYGASGLQWYVGGDRMPIDDFTVSAPTVQVGIAPATTPDAEVPLTQAATVTTKTGAFATSLPLPTTPGDYKVVSKACLAENCGIGVSTVTVP